MIYDVKKYVFAGAYSSLQRFMKRAQEKGLVHFESPSLKKKSWLSSSEINKTVEVIHTLSKYAGNNDDYPTNPEPKEIVNKVSELTVVIDRSIDKIHELTKEIRSLKPFGYFDIDDVRFITQNSQSKCHFYKKRRRKAEDEGLAGVLKVSSYKEYDYFLFIGKNEIDDIRYERIEIRDSLVALESLKNKYQKAKENAEETIRSFSNRKEYITDYLNTLLDKSDYQRHVDAASQSLDVSIFSISGWIPKKNVSAIKELIGNEPVVAYNVCIDKGDEIPTFMENTGLSKVGEDLVHVYDTPAVDDKDPSLFVLASFSLFFSMIVSDAGYGFLFFIAAMYLRYKVYNSAKKQIQRAITLLTTLSISCMVWGVATSSYFGMQLSSGNALVKYSPLTMLVHTKAEYHFAKKDRMYDYWINKQPEKSSANTSKEFLKMSATLKGPEAMTDAFANALLLDFSLLLGVIHISTSMLRNLRRNLPTSGWLLVLIGGYLFLPKFLKVDTILNVIGFVTPETAHYFGEQMLIGGLILATILSIYQNGVTGILEVLGITQLFADTLSYLRLYALGLAGMIIAATMNELGGKVGFFFGALIILLGHLVNISLATMAGVIHGLRLNYLEWYRYSFNGGGRLYNPFKKRMNKNIQE